ncbi:MAG: hypothetical protein ACOC10_00745 [Bacteroidota bacterium]
MMTVKLQNPNHNSQNPKGCLQHKLQFSNPINSEIDIVWIIGLALAVIRQADQIAGRLARNTNDARRKEQQKYNYPSNESNR